MYHGKYSAQVGPRNKTDWSAPWFAIQAFQPPTSPSSMKKAKLMTSKRCNGVAKDLNLPELGTVLYCTVHCI